MDELEPEDERILERFATYWCSAISPDEKTRCARLHAAGLMERMRQKRRGFPTMYRTKEPASDS